MNDFIARYSLDTRTYTIKGFQAVLYYFFLPASVPIFPMKRQYGEGYPLTLFFSSADLFEWCWDDEEMLKKGREFIEHVLLRPKYLDETIDRWILLRIAHEQHCQGFTLAQARDMSNQELIEKYHLINHGYAEQFGIAVGVQDPFSMRADALWHDRFKMVLQEKYDAVFPELLVATQPSFTEREYQDRLYILKQWQEDPNLDIMTLLQRHAETYFFIHNNYAKVNHPDANYFLAAIKQDREKGIIASQKLHELQVAHQKALERKQKLIEEFQLGREERLLLEIADRFSWQQDERKKTMMMTNHYLEIILKELSRRTGIKEEMLQWSCFDEIENVLLHGMRYDEEWKRRKEHCAVVQTEDGYEILSGASAKEVYDVLFPPREQVVSLNGMVASRGHARGRVKVLQKWDDVADMPQGAILVASMTRPEMVPAMQKAGAIVTNEGGITSHAAIISRELGIPCIIGTKRATEILKDGDDVDVDALIGVVTILSRSSKNKIT